MPNIARVGTNLSTYHIPSFYRYLDSMGLYEVYLGVYRNRTVYYSYKQNDSDTSQKMLIITLQYGSLETAFIEYKQTVEVPFI